MAAKKGVLTQGTHVWVEHGSVPTLTRVNCVKAVAWGDDSTTEISSTCLDEPETATVEYGLTTPGEGSIQIDTDPKNESHMTILQLAADRETVKVYVGWSDGVGEPTVSTGTVTLPPTRTWSHATVKLRKGPPVFDPDSLVNHTIPMKRQTKIIEEFKASI